MRKISLLLSIIFCFSFNLIAQKTYVPDDNFENYLESNGMGDGITNNDSVLNSNINTVISIDVNSLSISDLTGIEGFTDLTSLVAYGNFISNLDLTNLILLESLIFNSNQLTSLDLSNNLVLRDLRLNNNFITSLDLTNNTNLEILHLQNNQLTSIDIVSCDKLRYLEVNNNSLSNLNLSPCAFNDLCYQIPESFGHFVLRANDNLLNSIDLTNCNVLKALNLSQNNLNSLDLTSNDSLMQLDASQNDLFTLNLKNNNNINFTNLSSNFPTFDARFNPNLHCINVDDASYSSSNWTNIDSQQYFDNNCTYNFGCTDSLANNYDSTATVDDGSCIYLQILYTILLLTQLIILH